MPGKKRIFSAEKHASKLFVKRKTTGHKACPKGSHTARSYNNIRNTDDWCVKDCDNPIWKKVTKHVTKQAKKGGRCVGVKTQYMKHLLEFYRSKKAHNSDYKYSQAMVDFKPKWAKMKKN